MFGRWKKQSKSIAKHEAYMSLKKEKKRKCIYQPSLIAIGVLIYYMFLLSDKSKFGFPHIILAKVKMHLLLKLTTNLFCAFL